MKSNKGVTLMDVVIAIVMVIFFIGRFVGQWATKKFTEEKPTNQTEENRTIEII